jgi:transposase
MEDDRLRRHDLSDAEWARLEPLLPAHPRQGTGGMMTGW